VGKAILGIGTKAEEKVGEEGNFSYLCRHLPYIVYHSRV
jgi:hypothetical protein